jgi:hypothetical protein
MNTYLVLLRGINVGGKNRVPMAALIEVPGGAPRASPAVAIPR